MPRFSFANDFAPEHLSVPGGEESLVRENQFGGQRFHRPLSAQSVGDYASGTNHVLPTAGGPRVAGRAFHVGFRALLERAEDFAGRIALVGAGGRRSGRRRRLGGARRESRCVSEVRVSEVADRKPRRGVSVAVCGALSSYARRRGPRGQVAAGLQREHGGLLAGGAARAAANHAGAAGDLSGV